MPLLTWDGIAAGRSRRENGRVVREYIGTGPDAELIAALDEAYRERRETEAAAWRAERQELEAERAGVLAVGVAVNAAVGEALATMGYRKERGEWRRANART